MAMYALIRNAMLTLALSGLTACASGGASPTADLIITNARVYTVNDTQPWAQAIAVRDGVIVAVGSTEEVARLVGANTRAVDVGGRLVMPAFGDAHVHPVFGGMAYSRCSLHAGESVADYVEIIRGCVAATPGDGPIYGVGWEDAFFPPNGVPHKSVLDAITTDRALVFESVGGHSYWVNSRALQLARVTRATPDPVNGLINRDERTGEPSGGLQETAMGLVASLIPRPTPAEIEASIAYTARHFNSLGITNWHDAGVALSANGESETFEAYRAALADGVLTSHVSIAWTWANDRGLEQIPTIIEAARRAQSLGIRAVAVKFYVDGVIPQRTAAMIEPYEGSSDDSGSLQIAPDVLSAAVARLRAAGIQSHVHAIGDRATRVGLDAFEASGARDVAHFRPMISHLNVIDPADQPRFGATGAIAVFQPTWSSNYPYMDLTKQAIGPVRSQSIYPAASVLHGGGMLAYGADWPVATANPLLGLEVAITRTNYEDSASGPLLANEGVTLEQAIRAHTLNVAFATGNEDITGSIEVGKSADIVVLDRDIFAMAPADISQARVVTTLFRGASVFGSLDEVDAGAAN
ncbi:MAG TPA: amidohydrolase [Verrucomicrobiae bacterium]|nr:amidohydrolase [Verrucomicrobiae bacterium]